MAAADRRAHDEPPRPVVLFFRWWFPGLVILGGIVAFVANPSVMQAEGAAGVIGAGLAWILFGLLFRQGVRGDEERDVEDAARAFLDEHGRWPTDAEYAAYEQTGRWSRVSDGTGSAEGSRSPGSRPAT